MMQACRAYYQRGRFIPLESLNIPEGSQAIITILEDSPKELARRQREAIAQFRDEIRNCDEPVPDFERIKLREIEI